MKSNGIKLNFDKPAGAFWTTACLASVLLAATSLSAWKYRRKEHKKEKKQDGSDNNELNMQDGEGEKMDKNSEKIKFGKLPSVCLSLEVYTRIIAYARVCRGEISILGASQYLPENNEIWIRQVFLPRQYCSSASTEIDEEDLANILVEATRHDLTLDTWIHSHGEMEVFFSGTDQRTLDQSFPQSPLSIAIVVNRAGKLLARLLIQQPVQIEIQDCPIHIRLTNALDDEIQAEVEEKVSRGRSYLSKWENQSNLSELHPKANDLEEELVPSHWSA